MTIICIFKFYRNQRGMERSKIFKRLAEFSGKRRS